MDNINKRENCNVAFEDITEEFFQQCHNLDIGELAHSQLFSLQDAMSAIEIMDPKMDAGVQLPRRTTYLKEALEDNLLILSNFKLEDVVGIMDETLAAIVNWLEGDTLAQTVFINMYLHCVPLIEFKPLRVFCEGVKKIIVVAKGFILKASTFEEEDFCPSYNRLPLINIELTEQKVARLLKECDDEMNRDLRRGMDKSDLYSAIQYRIKFLRTLLLLLLAIERNIENTSDQPRSSSNPQSNFRQECFQYLELLSGLCNSIKDTISLGTPATGKDNPREEEYGLPGFEPFLNHYLLPPTIPRYRRIIDRDDALLYFQDCIGRVKHILGIFDYESSTDHILTTWTFLRYFSQKGVKGQSCLLSRSILLLLYLPPNKEKVFNSSSKVDVFKDILRYFINNQSWSLAQRSMEHNSIKAYIDKLCTECTNILFEIPTIYAFNRSRQRNRLEHLIETTWDLYQECNKGDACLRDVSHLLNSKTPLPSVFCSSLAFFLFQVVWEYVAIGFELELYLTHELSYVYNFLSDIILYNFAAHVTEILQQLNAGDRKAPTAGRKNKRKDKSGDDSKLEFVNGYLLVIRSHYNLSCGLFHALAAFVNDKKIETTNFPYGSEEIRFNRRFFTLLNCGWFGEANIYQRYKNQWDSLLQQTPQKLYADATCFFEAGGKCIEQCPPKMQSHVANLGQIAKRNMVVCKLLSSGHKAGPENPVQLVFEPESSMIFPMFRLC